MSKELLPELPRPVHQISVNPYTTVGVPIYSQDQMRAYGQACYEAGRKSVDLEQFRGPIEMAKLASEIHQHASYRFAIKECNRLLAIIDGEKS